MRLRRETTRVLPLLLLDPSPQSAAELASLLDSAGFEVVTSGDLDAALQALRRAFFFALIVVADLTDPSCLVALATLRRRAPRSWMIVAAPQCDAPTCDLIHRYGGDACVVLPIAAEDLVDRLNAFQARTRPSF